MNMAARRNPLSAGNGQRNELLGEERRGNPLPADEALRMRANDEAEVRSRVYIAAENRLLREALSRMLTRQGDIDVVGLNSPGPFQAEGLIEEKADILLLTSRGSLGEDVFVIRQVRLTAPTVRILLVGMTEDETEFFQYVRAGIRRYLQRDASAEDVLEAMHAVQAREAVCPGALCALLFRLFEREATSVHSAAIHPRLGLTRREQQIRSADRARADEQGNCEPILPVGANREESVVPHEAQCRSRRPIWNCASLPYTGISGLAVRAL